MPGFFDELREMLGAPLGMIPIAFVSSPAINSQPHIGGLTPAHRALLRAGYAEVVQGSSGWGIRPTQEGLDAMARADATSVAPEGTTPSAAILGAGNTMPGPSKLPALREIRRMRGVDVIEAATIAVDLAGSSAPDAEVEEACGELKRAVAAHRSAGAALAEEMERVHAAGMPEIGDRVVLWGDPDVYEVKPGTVAGIAFLAREGRGPLESNKRVIARGFTWDAGAGIWRQGQPGEHDA